MWVLGVNGRTDVYVAHVDCIPDDVRQAEVSGWRPMVWTRKPSDAATFVTAHAAERFAAGLSSRGHLAPVYCALARN